MEGQHDRATGGGTSVKTAAARLRDLLSRDDHIVVAPGVYDGLTARIALAQGFDCLYMASIVDRCSRVAC